MSSAKKWLSALIPTHNLAMIVLDPALQPCAAHVAALTKCGLRVETAERDNAPRFAPFLSRGAAPTGKPGQGSALVVLGSHRLPALASAAAWRDATDCALEELGLRPPGAAAAGDRHCPAVLVGWGDAEERSDGEELAAAQLARVGSMDDVVAGAPPCGMHPLQHVVSPSLSNLRRPATCGQHLVAIVLCVWPVSHFRGPGVCRHHPLAGHHQHPAHCARCSCFAVSVQ